MADDNGQDTRESEVRFSSDSHILEIREEDTQPGKPSETLRRWMEQKYGRKSPPPQDLPEKSD